MKSFIQKNHRLLFYGLWLLLALMQSGLTELQDDEAYYWVYSRFLDWGYFDHPPLTALLVKAGYAIFPNELGVRLFPAILNLFSLLIIENLIEKKNILLFYSIAASLAVLQLSGFNAVPDIPLIFFTALFFWVWKKFLNNASLFYSLLLGISSSLLLYSKYQAALIIIFVIASKPKLLLRYQIYIAGFIALLLFAPHLWWQYQHNWVSFRYHLFESNVNPYKFSFSIEYIIGQFLLAGPIAGFILLPASFLYKPKNGFESALKFSLIGILAFFFLSSFRGKVEANWTSPILVPLIILAHQFLNERANWQKIFLRTVPVSLALILIARISLIEDILPIKYIKQHYFAWKYWPQVMKQKTNDQSIVFNNSYQRASKYWFYTGQKTYSLNLYKGRRNNYNFWPIEDSLLGKPVFILDKYDLWKFPDSLHTPLGAIGYRYDSAFISFAKIQVEVNNKITTYQKDDSVSISYTFHIPENYKNFIQAHPILNDTTRIALFNKNGTWLKDIFTKISLNEVLKNPNGSIKFYPGVSSGTYQLLFAINSGTNFPSHNSQKIKWQIK